MSSATLTQPPATVDWGEMRALFVKGLSLTDLATRFDIPYSTVKSRAHREHWAHTVAKANDAVVQSATADLTASATHWVRRIDRLVHNSLTHAEKHATNGDLKIRDLQVVLDCAEKANRIARANYGLDKVETHNHVHLGLLAHDSSASSWQTKGLSDAGVVDIESTLLPTLTSPTSASTSSHEPSAPT